MKQHEIPSGLVLVTAPAEEPVTLAEAKLWAKIQITADDALVTSLIPTSRRECENELDRALVTQTWKLLLDRFPSEDETIYLPRPPLVSITHVKYIDSNGTLQTLATTEYTVDASKEPGRIVPAYGKSWPATRLVPNAVEVQFVAGYGAAAAVPDGIKSWIKIGVTTAYENREREAAASFSVLKFVDGLLDPYRWGSYV